MSDPALLAFGCGVSFIAFAGIYLGLRQRFLVRDEEGESEPPRDASLVPVAVPVPIPPRAPERAAQRSSR